LHQHYVRRLNVLDILLALHFWLVKLNAV